MKKLKASEIIARDYQDTKLVKMVETLEHQVIFLGNQLKNALTKINGTGKNEKL